MAGRWACAPPAVGRVVAGRRTADSFKQDQRLGVPMLLERVEVMRSSHPQSYLGLSNRAVSVLGTPKSCLRLEPEYAPTRPQRKESVSDSYRQRFKSVLRLYQKLNRAAKDSSPGSRFVSNALICWARSVF